MMKGDFLETALKQKSEIRRKNVMCGIEAILMLVIVVLVIIILWQKTIKLILTWKIIKLILECLLSAIAEIKIKKREA